MAPALDRPGLVGVVTLLLITGGVGLAAAPAGAVTTPDSTDGTATGLWWGDGGDTPTLDAASAEVTAETATGDVSEVTFDYDAPRGELVVLQVGAETEVVFATGVERTATVDLGGYFWSDTEEYPVEVSAKVVGGEKCSATVTEDDGVVTLCEDDGEPAYDLSIDSNAPVTEGEVATADATVENTGDAEGTEDVSVEVDGQSTTESVTIAPGESTTVSLDWQTEAGDAGNYTATAAVAGQSASTDVTVEPAVGGANFTVADVATNSPVAASTNLVVDATVENAGDQQGTQTVSLDAGPLDSTSTQLTLGAGATDTVSLTLGTTQDDAGEYVAAVSTDDDTETAVVTVETAEPQPFLGYVAGEEGYLDTNATDASVAPTEFAECADFAPTQDAIDDSPDYLPAPECITLAGTYYPSNDTWEGDVLFPQSITERTNPLLGEIYSAAEISTVDGAEGTLDRDTGEVTLDAAVNISVGVFAPEGGHGTPWAERGDSIVGDACHIPNVDLAATTGQSGDLAGNPLENDTATLVDTEFAIDSAQDCNNLAGSINDAQGIPTDPGQSEVVFDVVFDFQPDPSDGTVAGTVTDSDTGDPIENVSVTAGDASTTTDASGEYALSVEPGITTVTAESGASQSVSREVFVTAGDTTTADFELASVVESIELNVVGFGDDPAIALGEDPQLAVNATYSNGVTEDVTAPDLVSSDNESVVDVIGFLGVPIAQTDTENATTGQATLTAEFEGETDAQTVTVGPAELDFREITVREELAVGDTQAGVVQEVWTDGEMVDVTENFTVQSSDESVASVDRTAQGEILVTGESPGSVTLTATETPGTVQFTQPLTVSEAEVEVAGNETTASPGATTTVAFEATSLSGAAENVSEYTVALTVDGEDASLVDVEGADTQTVGDVVLVSDAPNAQTPAPLFEAEFQVSDNATPGAAIPIEIVDHRSEVIDVPGGFLTPTVYALPTWTDGSIAVEAPETGTVEGTVTDNDTGSAVAGATVSAGGQSTTTASDGSYAVSLPAGSYTVEADASGYESATQPLSVTAGGTTTADFALDPAAAPANVTITDLSTNSPVSEGDSLTVEATVQNVGDQQGTGTVSLDAGALGANSTQVSLAAGDTDTVSLSVPTSQGDAGDYTVEVSTDTDTVSAQVTVDGPQPREFEAYVAGEVGYLDTNATDPGVPPIEFTECADFAPTQDAIDDSPDYLPAPECITLSGTYYPSNDTWAGDVDFPVSVSERTNPLLGEIYSSAEITTDGGASGTLNPATGEMTLETTASIEVAVYSLDSGHGTPWADRGDSVVGDACHIPNVDLAATTGQSGNMAGTPLENGTATLVDNEFAIASAQDCNNLAGSINNAQGIPTDSGQSEARFDVVIAFTDN